MISRREFIGALLGGAAAIRPLAGTAQQPGKLPRVGILEPYAAADPGYRVRQALRDDGYVEGRDIVVEERYGEGDVARLPALAAELAGLHLDAIVAIGDTAILAVRRAAATTPIVAGSDDLVGEGHAASLARPGGNVTGVSILGSELNAKRLELLKQTVPSAARVAVFWDPATGTFHLAQLRAVAGALGVELAIHEIRGADDLDRAFAAARAWHADALNVLASPLLHARRLRIIEGAARDRLPAIYQWAESTEAGGLMSYGPVRAEVYRAIGVQLERVVKGAKPGSLPIEQPTTFELAVNLKTARALGLAIPSAVLDRADETIE
jgi:putative ABC transport system substrate-binding protein